MEWEKYCQQISEFLNNGYIRESQSPFATPVIFVHKTQLDDTKKELQIVTDYRAPNQVVVNDSFPLLLPDELIDRLQMEKFFSKIDFYSRYHQERVASDNSKKMAFVRSDGLSEWSVVP
jgi:hypothetical protein